MRNTAKVIVEIEIRNAGGEWSDDCPVSQIKKQARDSALIEVDNMIQKMYPRVRRIGEPRIVVMCFEDEVK